MKDIKLTSEGWGDGTVHKVLLMKARGPDFRFLVST